MDLINQIRTMVSSSPVETVSTPAASTDKQLVPSS